MKKSERGELAKEVFDARLLEDLERAEKYIFMEYFIISRGEFWDSILEVLARKVKEGVEVRFMYDYGMKRYLGVIEDIIRGMKDVWKLPAWNKDTPILTMLPFHCSTWVNSRLHFPADFCENLIKLDTARQWFHPAVYELYEENYFSP